MLLRVFAQDWDHINCLFARCKSLCNPLQTEKYTVEPGYNDIGLYDTSSIASDILWYQLILYIMYSYFYAYVLLLLRMFCSMYCVSLCCSVYCLYVKLYCSAATGCQPNCSYQNYHISYQFVTVDHTDRLGQHSFITTHYIHCHDIITEFDSNFYLLTHWHTTFYNTWRTYIYIYIWRAYS